MTGLSDIPAYLSGPVLLGALAGMGLVVGALTGLFGVGGAFVIVPLLNVLLGIPYTLAAGCSMCFTIGTSASGWSRHQSLGHVATKTMIILGGAGVCGAVLGADLHVHLKSALSASPAQGSGQAFTLTMHLLFILTLLIAGWLVLRWSPHETPGPSLLQRLPLGPRIEIQRANLRGISLPGLCAVGLGIGIFGGLLGIGGGVLLMPVMLLVVGVGIHQAVGTSLGVVLFVSVAGAAIYGADGEVNLWIVMALLVGSTLGVQIGAWLCHRLHARHIQRYFSLFILLVVLVIAWDFVRRLIG